MSSKARQTIKIRVKRGNSNGQVKPCGSCGGTGVVRNSGGKK